MDEIMQIMLTKAVEALPKAYAPYSKFCVSCCVQSMDDHLFVGVNVENASFSLTTCAEASAIAQMITNGGQRIKNLLIVTHDDTLCPPCGGCRQRIHEFASSNTRIHLATQKNILKTLTIDELLPLAFELNR